MEELAERIEERVGLDQRAVEIDAERARPIVALDRLGDLEILKQDVLVKLAAPAGPRESFHARQERRKASETQQRVNSPVKYTVKTSVGRGGKPLSRRGSIGLQ